MTELETKLLAQLKGLLFDIEGLMGESGGVYGLHLNGDVSTWSELDDEGGRLEWLIHLSSAGAAIAEAEIDHHDIGFPVHMKILVTRPHGTYWSARRIADGTDVAFTGDTPMDAIRKTFGKSSAPNFCACCGKRLVAGDVHTCTPPMSRDAELEQARSEEREACTKLCDTIKSDRWDLFYKGHPPYSGPEPERASDLTQGEALGAEQCAAAIRARGQK